MLTGGLPDDHATEVIDPRIVALAAADVPVLFSGAPATDTARMARLLHAWSRRAGSPFLEVRLPLIPEGFLEPELFGMERGAFCGPPLCWGVRGVVDRARGGTVLLCDIETLGFSAQARLAHLLQTGRFRTIGGVEESAADVRIVATTTEDLGRLVGLRLRRDLHDILASHEVALR